MKNKRIIFLISNDHIKKIFFKKVTRISNYFIAKITKKNVYYFQNIVENIDVLKQMKL